MFAEGRSARALCNSLNSWSKQPAEPAGRRWGAAPPGWDRWSLACFISFPGAERRQPGAAEAGARPGTQAVRVACCPRAPGPLWSWSGRALAPTPGTRATPELVLAVTPSALWPRPATGPSGAALPVPGDLPSPQWL